MGPACVDRADLLRTDRLLVDACLSWRQLGYDSEVGEIFEYSYGE
jgi:hypothetical protein